MSKNNTDQKKVTRRQLLAASGAIAIARSAAAEIPDQAQGRSPPRGVITELYGDGSVPVIGMTEDGPLYPPGDIPWQADFVQVTPGAPRAKGQLLYLFGRILTRQGNPLENATVEIWQTDYNGNYRHPRGWGQDELDPNFGYFGKVRTNSEGFYLFKTIQPRWYSLFGMPRAAHIHIKMRHLDHGVLTTEAYFGNASHEEIAPQDEVFLSRSKDVRDRIVLTEGSPERYSGLDIEFEPESICCQYDLAFFL